MADRLKIGMTFRKILPLLLIIAVPEIFAQETQTFMKLRLAHGLEDSGEWEQAIRIYEELYLLEPNNFAVVDGLQHAYAQIKEYGKAIVTVRKWLVFQSRDVSMEARLGGLYFDSGDERAADSVWSAIIKSEPLNVQAYRIVSGEMTLHRLYEKSISVYTEGRSRIGNNILFADELGTLYAALLQYGQAAGEYIRLVKYSPDQMYFAQSRMSSFITRPEAARSAAAVMSSEIKSTPANTALRRLNAWLLIEEKKYGEALEEYRVIDKLTNAEGSEIFNFAQRLSRESLYALAAEAFREIIGSGKNMQLIPCARYGYAFSVERLNGGAGGDTSEQACREVLELYESIVRSYPRTDLAAQALLRIGIVRYERLSDLDGALDALRHVEKVRPSSNYAYESWLKTGEVLTARNELEKARSEYEKLLTVNVNRDNYRFQAEFRIAELDYFEGRFDSALSELKIFGNNLNTDLTNDALQLQYFIAENIGTAPQALMQFAEADLLMRRSRYSESMALFSDVIKNYPDALLIDDATMKVGELCLHLHRPEEAIKTFRFIADSINISILKDRSIFRIAETYQNVLGRKEPAKAAYEELITRFPNSMYVEECRKRIRILRGDAI